MMMMIFEKKLLLRLPKEVAEKTKKEKQQKYKNKVFPDVGCREELLDKLSF